MKNDGVYDLNVSAIVKLNLPRVKVHFYFMASEDGNFTCRSLILDRTIDACRVNEKSMSGPILSTIYKTISQKINFPLECPYRKGFYQLQNGGMNLPKISFKLWTGFYCSRITVSSKLVKSRKFDDILIIKSKASIIL